MVIPEPDTPQAWKLGRTVDFANNISHMIVDMSWQVVLSINKHEDP